MRIVRALADLPGEIAAARGRGGVGVRRRHRLRRAVRRARPARRGAGRRHGRRRPGLRRARLLAPAPAPEGGRGGAGTRPARRGPRRAARRRARGGRGDRLPRRRHRRVPLRPGDRAVLVPGDEHPPPGRAPGHRAGARRRPGRAAARGRRGRRVRRSARSDPTTDGHAIEVRLYAEDPAADYQPQSGTADARSRSRSSDGIRVDAGFESGSEVSTHYDAMLAKVIAHAPTREQAARQLAGVLRRARIHGVVTNRDQLVADPARRAVPGRRGQHRLPRRWSSARPRPRRTGQAPVAAAIALAEQARERRTVQRGIPVAWRNVVSQPQGTEFEGDVRVEWWGGRDGYVRRGADGGRRRARPAWCWRPTACGRRTTCGHGRPRASTSTGRAATSALRRVPRFVDPADAVASGSLLAPMPGTVVSVAVEAGQQVEAGQPVLVLEAMKMQHTVERADAGTVTEIDVKPGAQVAAGEVLAVVEEAAEETAVSNASASPRSARRCARRWRSWPAKYGRDYFTEKARAAARPPTCGWRSARTATSASTSPRSTAAVAAASATSPRSARSSPRRAARCC